MIYDIAIIGGGIAGLALSIDLKIRGYAVLVIEKGSYPRHKVCGEYVSIESQSYLYKICPELVNLQLPIITNFKLTSGNRQFTTRLDSGGFGISRYLLEELLYKEATKQGVVFKLTTKATEVIQEQNNYIIKTNAEDLEALLVCNSSGRKSNFEVGKKGWQAEGTNYVGVKYHINLQRKSDLIEIHNFQGGYCGISNIENNKACLCYIVNSKYLRNANNSISELEKNVLYKNKQLEKIFTKSEFIYKEPLTISGINFRVKRTSNATSLFLGDSAGCIAPITGNGMSIGLRSAWVLANEIDSYFLKKNSHEQLLKNYTQFWNSQFTTRIKLSRYFQKLAEYPVLTRMTIGVFNTIPYLANATIKKTYGKPF